MKTHEKIRTISTSYSGDRFAAAEFEKRVQLWDLNSGLIRVIDTDFDFGGRRLTISPNGKYLTVGSYNKNTITTYSIDSGDILWTRKDLKRCGKVIHVEFENGYIFVTLERQTSQILSVQTGETIQKINGSQGLWELGRQTNAIVEKSEWINLTNREFKTLKSMPKRSFAILDSAFTVDKFVASYSTGPLECIDLTNFESRWTNKPIGHFLDIEINPELNKVFGIRWEYEKGSNKFLTSLDIQTGQMEAEFDLGNVIEHSFLKQGKYVVLSTGKLVSTSAGKIIKEFDFENS